jgi:hypothetical protein
MKMRGWYKESYRHYLASKGVVTRKYLARRRRSEYKFISRPYSKKEWEIAIKGLENKEREKKYYEGLDFAEKLANSRFESAKLSGNALVPYDAGQKELLDFARKNELSDRQVEEIVAEFRARRAQRRLREAS